jgi:hypothetical protein
VGTINASGDVTGFSDARVKRNFQVIDNALDKVLSIQGYTFSRDGEPDEVRHAGVIAQEIQKVLPEVVYTNTNGTMSVAYGNITALLVQAIHELNAKLAQMQPNI